MYLGCIDKMYMGMNQTLNVAYMYLKGRKPPMPAYSADTQVKSDPVCP